MFKRFILFSSIFITQFLHAEIYEITQIEDVRPYITERTLCLFDIDDTLIDNPISLGSPPWRSWIKSKVANSSAPFVMYDALTLYIAKNTPYKAMEPTTAKLILDLQQSGTPVFAFTARGRTQWYTTDIEGVDRFTHEQLNHAGIDFKKTQIPQELLSLESIYFNDGIIFAQHIKKGDLLKHLFKDLSYFPPLIIFIDDKLDQVQSVEAAVKEAGIPFIGFWYRRSESDRANFNPHAANIQLETLLLGGEIVTDEEAILMAQLKSERDPAHDFKQILEEVNLQQINPKLP